MSIIWGGFCGTISGHCTNFCTILDTTQPPRETVVYQSVRVVQYKYLLTFVSTPKNCTAFPVHTVPRGFMGVNRRFLRGWGCTHTEKKNKKYLWGQGAVSLLSVLPPPPPLRRWGFRVTFVGIWRYALALLDPFFIWFELFGFSDFSDFLIRA